MRPSHHPRIRQLLRAEGDGLTVVEISRALAILPNSADAALRTMPDTYIDRWLVNGQRGGAAAVWCAAEVPANCPRPATKGAK